MVEFPILYQTIEDRCNADKVEEHGPYKSQKSHWLGCGYYFWDRNYERAEWWGKERYKKNGYMICQANAKCNDIQFFDLFDNPDHKKIFKETYESLKRKYDQKNPQYKDISVNYIIHYLQTTKNFPFKIIRAESENCGEDIRIPFSPQYRSFLNLNKAIQICIFDKSLIYDYRVIYPQEYAEPIG